MKTQFVANGFGRWKKGQAEKIRRSADLNQPQSFFGKISQWFKTEKLILKSSPEENEKTSPKILW